MDLLAQVLLDDIQSTNFTSVIKSIRKLSASHTATKVGLQSQMGRGIALIYSLLGVPINAILIGTLGSYFGKTGSVI